MSDYEIVKYIIKKSDWIKPKLHIGCHRLEEGQRPFSELSSEQMIQRGKSQSGVGGNNTKTDKALSQADSVELVVVRQLTDIDEKRAEFIKDRVRLAQDSQKFDLLGNQISDRRVAEIRQEALDEFTALINNSGGTPKSLSDLSISERSKFRDRVIDRVMFDGEPMAEAFHNELEKLS